MPLDLSQENEDDLILVLYELISEIRTFDNEIMEEIRKISAELRARVLTEILAQSARGPGKLHS